MQTELPSRIPPHSIEAEQSVLGSLLISARAYDEVSGRLAAEDFYRLDHRLIFNAISRLSSDGMPADVITVHQRLVEIGDHERTGGLAYLTELAQSTPTAANVLTYARIVRERRVMRELIEVGTELTRLGFDPSGRSARDLIELAEQRIFALGEQDARAQTGFLHIHDGLKLSMDALAERVDRGGGLTGLPTGFKRLDDMTAGLQASDLIIVAGRPSMGKTSFAMNIAQNVAIKSQLSVGVFSMEMSTLQLTNRLLCSLGRIDQSRFRTGQLEPEDWDSLSGTAALLGKSRIYIDETAALSPGDLRARARRLARSVPRDRPLGLLVVDYLQLMQVPGTRENRTAEISAISRGLKALAKELNVPVIALSQLNRKLEDRADKRPQMSDLRESGSIEQDADVILFIYRDVVYNKTSDRPNEAEIIISKQRNGPTGVIHLAFLNQFTRFENLTRESAFGSVAE